ncbi:hypothetical protein [Stutzerimonas xanthomarina]|uniref:hypothetical protein n=1 Tax=Stutzerimonas xanthomarina TaxID=271420 RepID=UPI003AA80B38
MSNLETNSHDRLVSAAKGVVGACPLIGPLAAEALGAIIPKQRLDRVVEFLRGLESEVQKLDCRLEKFEENIVGAEGLDILEEGLIQAARSVSIQRKQRLARLVGRSLTKDEVDYEESRKLLNLFRDLTDPEVIWLIYYSLNPVMGSGPHQDLIAKHPDVLKPISRAMGAPQDQTDRAALQDSYKNTLLRYGLIERRGKSNQTTSLGRLMVRYIQEEKS